MAFQPDIKFAIRVKTGVTPTFTVSMETQKMRLRKNLVRKNVDRAPKIGRSLWRI
jgi:hypothetical protein